jgi:hypothetical protein
MGSLFVLLRRRIGVEFIKEPMLEFKGIVGFSGGICMGGTLQRWFSYKTRWRLSGRTKPIELHTRYNWGILATEWVILTRSCVVVAVTMQRCALA